MRSRSTSKITNIIQEADLFAAPMEIGHKHLALRHLHRLRKILNEPAGDAIGRHVSKQAVREQLARMTVVFRQYEAMWAKGEIEDTAESMVVDMIDASLALEGRRGTYDQAVFPSPLLMGREQEVAALMQELEAESVDDVLELWNAPSKAEENVLPDNTVMDNIGADIDWTKTLVRCKSENNIVYYRGPKVVIRDRPKFTRSLSTKNARCWDYSWPPKATEVKSFEERQRALANGNDWEDW